jgi:hypothetical protein
MRRFYSWGFGARRGWSGCEGFGCVAVLIGQMVIRLTCLRSWDGQSWATSGNFI